MIRTFLSRRWLCTGSTAAPVSRFHEKVLSELEKLNDGDWVDTEGDHAIDLMVESAESVINEYRKQYTADTPQDKLYDDVALLYRTKEVASIVEAYAELAEDVMRKHEVMVGVVVGNNTEIPEGEGDTAIQVMRDYVRLMNMVEDESIRQKVEMELGRKMVHLKSMLSMENFSAEIAPIAGDRILPVTPKPTSLPTQPEKK